MTGGTFYRGTTTSSPATISDFRLDKYEVTVGRFRKFLDAWAAGWRPTAGSGKHTHLNGGSGLVNTAGGYEPGWDATWTAYLGAAGASTVTPTGPGAANKGEWEARLKCSPTSGTWTDSAGVHEGKPMNCLSWYDAHAFCIWDGGGLPSEAEWEYAAAGGSEERTYPWGEVAPGANTSLAIYGCYFNGTGTCAGVANVAPVGAAPAGASKAGQLDLAGNMWERNLDWYQTAYVTPCNNCANLTAGLSRAARGGSFYGSASYLPASSRNTAYPAERYNYIGGRCARHPTAPACAVESDAAFCTRLGAECGTKSGLDSCGVARTVSSCGTCSGALTCSHTNTCAFAGNELAATTAGLTGDGLDNCGAAGTDVCARSLLVTGGTFYRGTDASYPATISDFRLDRYEVTVGRFRKFVDAWVGGWRPTAGSGKHTHLNGGSGLVNTGGGFEPGWDATWTGYVGAPTDSSDAPSGAGATTKAQWDTNLICSGPFATWTSAGGANEKRPQNCVSWYDVYAYCVWDGGFVPSEAEWEYATAGGNEERFYPWGGAAPTEAHASYYVNSTRQCRGDGVDGCTLNDLGFVGSKPTGDGRFGQSDLVGNVWEWGLDGYQSPYASPCDNCARFQPTLYGVIRGGSFNNDEFSLYAASRSYKYRANRNYNNGGRCARTP